MYNFKIIYTKNSGTIKQIFIRGGTKGSITEKRIYIRTGYKGTASTWSYGDWTPALGHTDWTMIDELGNKVFGISQASEKTSAGDIYYTIEKKNINDATILVQRRKFLDMYQSYDYINHFFMHITIDTIKAKIDEAINKYKGDSNRVACAAIQRKCYTYSKQHSVKREYIDLIFTYNKNNEVCLVGADGSRTGSFKYLRFKQYD